MTGLEEVFRHMSHPLDAWMRFADAVSIMRKEFGKNLKKFDLSLMEYRTLARLEEAGPSPMVRIADELLMTRAGTTLLTDKLENRGLVSRVRKSGDRRVIFITITAKGKRLLSRAKKSHDELGTGKLNNLTEDEIRALLEIVEKLSGKEVHAHPSAVK